MPKFTSAKFEYLFVLPSNPDPNQFYLIEDEEAHLALYFSDRVGNLFLINDSIYGDFQAVNAVAGVLQDTPTVHFTYTDSPEQIITAEVPDEAITFAKIQNVSTDILVGRSTAGFGSLEEITIGAGLTLIAGELAATSTGTDTEAVQDAVGSILLDSSTIDFTYDDATPTITAIVKDDSVTFSKVQNIATSKLLGRSTAGSGDIEELSIGSGLSLVGGTLAATGTSLTQEQVEDIVGAMVSGNSETGVSVTYDDTNGKLDFNVTVSAAFTADTATVTTASLAYLAEETGTIALGKHSLVSNVTADRGCRVRIYSTSAHRTADIARPIGTDPSGEHGLMLEVVIVAGNLSLDLSPVVTIVNQDVTPVSNLYYVIQNLSGSTSTVAVTFRKLTLET